MTELGYTLPMLVRVVLTGIAGEGCRVSIVSSGYFGHVWSKNYESKHICLTEIRTLGLLTAAQVAEVHASNFDKIGGSMIFQGGVTEPEGLIAAHFEQQP